MNKGRPYKRYACVADIPGKTVTRMKRRILLDRTSGSEKVPVNDVYEDEVSELVSPENEILPVTTGDQVLSDVHAYEADGLLCLENEIIPGTIIDQALAYEVNFAEGSDACLLAGNEETENDDDQTAFSEESRNDENEDIVQDEKDDQGGWNIEDGNDPLYTGATVSKAQGLLLILAFLLRHHLTDVALSDLLSILGVLLPNAFPDTKYKFHKAFENGETQVHFYCPLCTSYLGRENMRQTCQSCGAECDNEQAIKDGTFFLYIPIKEQLVDILNNAKLFPHLTDRHVDELLAANCITDITTSSLYKDLIRNHNLSGNDLTLTWNTDGIPIFKSSGYQIWPIQCFVNELPPHLRADNILLTGLWFGNSKPSNMNTFLRPFIDECTELEEIGFEFEGVQRKVFTLICCADSPARAMIRNCKQFNGNFGCDWCEHQGDTILRERGPPTRNYLYREVPLRTATKQAEYALEAEATNEAVKGVKGLSIIQQLPTFNVVDGMTPEYMHSVCQGVTKQLVSLWMDSPNHTEPYYIGRMKADIDLRLAAISPPSEISRAPRSLQDRKFWKASEWRALLLYGLVVFTGILPTRYLQHFFLLTFSIFTLLGENITSTSVAVADACLSKFVLQMEELYGIAACTFNVHQLVHLARGVEMCGPLWATSAFTFESKNRDLLKLFSGTQSVPQQICSSFNLMRKLPILARNSLSTANVDALAVFHQLTNGISLSSRRKVLDNGLFCLGKGKPMTLTVPEIISLINLLEFDILNRNAIIYHKFTHNNVLFSSQYYTRALKHNDSYVKLENGSYGRILGLYAVKPRCLCTVEAIQYCLCDTYNIILLKIWKRINSCMYKDVDLGAESNFLCEVYECNQIVAIFPSEITKKCIKLQIRGKVYFCELPCRLYDN